VCFSSLNLDDSSSAKKIKTEPLDQSIEEVTSSPEQNLLNGKEFVTQPWRTTQVTILYNSLVLKKFLGLGKGSQCLVIVFRPLKQQLFGVALCWVISGFIHNLVGVVVGMNYFSLGLLNAGSHTTHTAVT
jgi:hypothetical protein